MRSPAGKHCPCESCKHFEGVWTNLQGEHPVFCDLGKVRAIDNLLPCDFWESMIHIPKKGVN